MKAYLKAFIETTKEVPTHDIIKELQDKGIHSNISLSPNRIVNYVKEFADFDKAKKMWSPRTRPKVLDGTFSKKVQRITKE